MAVSPVFGGLYMAILRKAKTMASVFPSAVLLAIPFPMEYHAHLERAHRAAYLILNR
jgi:hypothetical protein